MIRKMSAKMIKFLKKLKKKNNVLSVLKTHTTLYFDQCLLFVQNLYDIVEKDRMYNLYVHTELDNH